MKNIFLIILLTGITQLASAQNGPKAVTQQQLQSIKAEVEKSVPAFKKKLAVDDRSAAQVEFMADTFRIERVFSRVINIDYSTAGMRNATSTRSQEYDKLLNKYYSKLLKLLQPEDQKTLVAAQRSWIAFRDNERKLIGAMMDDKYTGGGTMHQIVASSRGADLVVDRARAIAMYYIYVADNK